MKLLFDQNLSWRLPQKLADLYHDSQHIREVGMKESQDMDTQLSEILQLSVAERIQLVEDIWDSIATVPDAVSLTEEQHAKLERRLGAYQANPSEGILWNDLKNKLRKQA